MLLFVAGALLGVNMRHIHACEYCDFEAQVTVNVATISLTKNTFDLVALISSNVLAKCEYSWM